MKALRIVYDAVAYYKIMHWVQEAGLDEISGFGKVTRLKDGTLKVIDAILLPQRNGAGHTEIEANDLGKAEFLLKDTPGELRLWWHSHVKMECFWSSTDLDTIELLGRHGWILATVFNQRWENRTAVYYGEKIDAFFDNLSISTAMEIPDEMKVPWDAEFKKNVTDVRPKHLSGFFRDWPKQRHQKLSKANRKHVMTALRKEDPIAAIFETATYGKVLYRSSHHANYKIWLPRPDDKHRLISVDWWDLVKGVVKVIWVGSDPRVIASLRYECESSQPNEVIVKYMTAMMSREAAKNKTKADADDEEDNGIPLRLRAANGFGQFTEILDDGEITEGPTIADLLEEAGTTETQLKTMYPNWDTMSELRKAELIDEFDGTSNGQQTIQGFYEGRP